MRSTVIRINAQTDLSQQVKGEQLDSPHLVIAFLPPDKQLQSKLDLINQRWPDSVIVGATAQHQFTGDKLHKDGTLQLFWLENNCN